MDHVSTFGACVYGGGRAMANTPDDHQFITRGEYWKDKYEKEKEDNKKWIKVYDTIDTLADTMKSSNHDTQLSIQQLTGSVNGLNKTIVETQKNVRKHEEILPGLINSEDMTPKEKKQAWFKLASIGVTGLVGTGGGLYALAQILF